MRFTLISSILLFSTIGFACPDIAGKYKCSNNATPDWVRNTEVRQESKGGVTTYTLAEVQEDGSEYLDVLQADGVVRSSEKFTRIVATCDGDKVFYSRTYAESGSTHNVNVVRQFYPGGSGSVPSLVFSVEYVDVTGGKKAHQYELEVCHPVL